MTTARAENFRAPGIRTPERGEFNISLLWLRQDFLPPGTEAEVNEVNFPLPPGFCQPSLKALGADQ
jgi:hypothetical protein